MVHLYTYNLTLQNNIGFTTRNSLNQNNYTIPQQIRPLFASTPNDSVYTYNDYVDSRMTPRPSIGPVMSTHNLNGNRKAFNRFNNGSYPVLKSSISSFDSVKHETVNNNNRFLKNANVNNNKLQTNSRIEYPLSDYEIRLLNARSPFELTDKTEKIAVNDEHGLWANKNECLDWKGDFPLSDYIINEDLNPDVISKKSTKKLEYIQECAIRYLRPPTPPPPGEIIIKQEKNIQTLPAPPLIIRQQPERIKTPEPIVIREAPPTPPKPVGRKHIIIPGKKLPPPPRKVIIERLPQLPPKPPHIIIERWLPYEPVKRKVVYRPAPPTPVIKPPKNVIVQWEAPEVEIKKKINYLGVFKENPDEYLQKYGSQIKETKDLPDIVNHLKPPSGIVLAADYNKNRINQYPELEGDVNALNLIDLETENLSQYKHILNKYNRQNTNMNSKFSKNWESNATLNKSADEIFSTATSFSFKTDDSKIDFPRSSTPIEKENKSRLVSSDSETNLLIHLIFKTFDVNNNGYITIEDAKNVFKKLNARFKRNYSELDGANFFTLLDSKNKKSLSLEEFQKAFTAILPSDI